MLLPPIDGGTEVWAAGVTYARSRSAREEESSVSRVYELVYEADRPELFFKSVAWRVVTDGEPIGIRQDSDVNVPEAELALVVNAAGETVGYTVCNDVSSRSIEGENPLYLPQAKMYAGSCALASGIRPAWEVTDPGRLGIELEVSRAGGTGLAGLDQYGASVSSATRPGELALRRAGVPGRGDPVHRHRHRARDGLHPPGGRRGPHHHRPGGHADQSGGQRQGRLLVVDALRRRSGRSSPPLGGRSATVPARSHRPGDRSVARPALCTLTAVRIGVLTGGGDCPGLNAVIRAVVRKGVEVYGDEFVGFRDGWRGPLEGDTMTLDVSRRPGHPAPRRDHPRIEPDQPLPTGGRRASSCSTPSSRLGIDGLVAIGGEDTLGVATKLAATGLPVVGVPKTIDNDLGATDYTFGFDTAVMIATEAIDRLHTTAESHHRVLIVEVMGRHAGWIAWHAGVAGGANVILIPERAVRHRRGVRSSSSTASPATTPPSWWWPRAPSRPRGRCRPVTGRSTLSGTSASAASATCWRRRSPGAPARRPGPPCSATSSGAGARRRSTGSWPPGSACTPWTPSTEAKEGRWWPCTARPSSSVPLSEATAQLKLVSDELFEEAEVFFG